MTAKRKTSSSRSRRSSRAKKNNSLQRMLLLLLVIGVLFLLDSSGIPIFEKIVTLFGIENTQAPDNQSRGIKSETIQLTEIAQGYPDIGKNPGEIETYSGFHLSYNEQHEQANWVAYILTKKQVKTSKAERTDYFEEDTNISTSSAVHSDYSGSGYDRGHLAPAADMKWSEKSMEESFLMSNMSPQAPGFNRGVWRELEEKVRHWAVKNKKLYIVTGPIFGKNPEKIGKKNRVSVPKAYFKVLLDIQPDQYKGIAFYLENGQSDEELSTFAMSIDQLEAKTGYDFFHTVESADIDSVEKQLNLAAWGLN